jgi:hypothetical protein
VPAEAESLVRGIVSRLLGNTFPRVCKDFSLAGKLLCLSLPRRNTGSWSRDSVILFSQAKFTGPNNRQGRALFQVSAAGGQVNPVLQLDNSREERSQIEPQFLPDGRHFLYRSVTGRQGAEKDTIYLGSLDSTETKLLTSVDSNGIFVPPGFILFGRQETLLAQPFDVQKVRPSGESRSCSGRACRASAASASIFTFFSLAKRRVGLSQRNISKHTARLVQTRWRKAGTDSRTRTKRGHADLSG